MTSRSSVAMAALLPLIASLSARADIPVYASDRDDGFDTGVATVEGPTLVHVWFDAGNVAPTAGLECQPAGGGSEVCQWALQFVTTGNLVISDVGWNGPPRALAFVPVPGASLQLGAGVAALAGLARRRARRRIST